MLLKEYRKEIFRPECNPNFKSLHCIARLDLAPSLGADGESTKITHSVVRRPLISSSTYENLPR